MKLKFSFSNECKRHMLVSVFYFSVKTYLGTAHHCWSCESYFCEESELNNFVAGRVLIMVAFPLFPIWKFFLIYVTLIFFWLQINHLFFSILKFLMARKLTLSWRRSLPYGNQSINKQGKSVDWFLYASDLRHERVKYQVLL